MSAIKGKLLHLWVFLRADQRLLRPGTYRPKKGSYVRRLYVGRRATLECLPHTVLTVEQLWLWGTVDAQSTFEMTVEGDRSG